MFAPQRLRPPFLNTVTVAVHTHRDNQRDLHYRQHTVSCPLPLSLPLSLSLPLPFPQMSPAGCCAKGTVVERVLWGPPCPCCRQFFLQSHACFQRDASSSAGPAVGSSASTASAPCAACIRELAITTDRTVDALLSVRSDWSSGGDSRSSKLRLRRTLSQRERFFSEWWTSLSSMLLLGLVWASWAKRWHTRSL